MNETIRIANGAVSDFCSRHPDICARLGYDPTQSDGGDGDGGGGGGGGGVDDTGIDAFDINPGGGGGGYGGSGGGGGTGTGGGGGGGDTIDIEAGALDKTGMHGDNGPSVQELIAMFGEDWFSNIVSQIAGGTSTTSRRPPVAIIGPAA